MSNVGHQKSTHSSRHLASSAFIAHVRNDTRNRVCYISGLGIV